MGYNKVIGRDFIDISKVCGWSAALRWLFCIAASLPKCLSRGNLQPADKKMGSGPFRVRRGSATALLAGPQVFSGLREIWARDVYLKGNFLVIPPGAFVVDLGANVGSFTLRALAAHPSVTVVAVEPSVALSDSLRRTVALNGWSNRVTVKQGFIGLETRVQQTDKATKADYQSASYMSEQDLLVNRRGGRVDFLKCDIEGSEFFLLEPGSSLLARTDRLAIEIHSWGGPVEKFLEHLRAVGFELGPIFYDSTGSCIALCRRVRLAGAITNITPEPALRQTA